MELHTVGSLYLISVPHTSSFVLRAILACGQDIMEPFHYINQVPGKDFRGRLIDAFQVQQFFLSVLS